MEVSRTAWTLAFAAPHWWQQPPSAAWTCRCSSLGNSLSARGFSTSTPSRVTPGRVGDGLSRLLIPLVAYSFDMIFCTMLLSIELLRDPCRSCCSRFLARPRHPNQDTTKKTPRESINTPIAIGAALSFCSRSRSFPLFVVALTPMQMKTRPPNTISGANPLESFEHLRARSDSCSRNLALY